MRGSLCRFVNPGCSHQVQSICSHSRVLDFPDLFCLLVHAVECCIFPDVYFDF